MAIDLTVPAWLEAKMNFWIDKLAMWEWAIKLRLEMVVLNDEGYHGAAQVLGDTSTGRIAIRADVEDTEEWEITLVHELLHIKHGRIDDVIYRVFRPQMDIPDDMVESVYKRALEPYIESMAKALVKLNQGVAANE